MSIKIAVQSKGRLRNPSISYLETLGLKFNLLTKKDRSYFAKCQNSPLTLVFLRDDDIPAIVASGLVDFGIIGLNEVLETLQQVEIIKNLNFAKCELVLAVPDTSEYQEATSLKNTLQQAKIATSYPNLTKSFLQKNNIQASIITLHGSVEIAPQIGLANAISDLVQTGKTLKENKLKKIATIVESQAVLIQSKQKTSAQQEFLKKYL